MHTTDFFLENNKNSLELSEEAPLTHIYTLTIVISIVI